MKKIKKIISVILVLVMTISSVGCAYGKRVCKEGPHGTESCAVKKPDYGIWSALGMFAILVAMAISIAKTDPNEDK